MYILRDAKNMKKAYILPIFLLVFCLTGCEKINSGDGDMEPEQKIFKEISAAKDTNAIGVPESNTAYANEAEKQDCAEENTAEISGTWQNAYKNIISNIESNLADPYNFKSFNGWVYVGLHDFDNNEIPELIIGSSVSVAVFTYEEGNAKKIADLYETEEWGGLNFLCYKDNHLVLICSGNGGADYLGGNGYVCFTYEQGEYITGFYCGYHPDETTINGAHVSEEEFLQQFDILKLKENSQIKYCKVNDKDEITLSGSDEWIAIDDLDLSLIEW